MVDEYCFSFGSKNNEPKNTSPPLSSGHFVEVGQDFGDRRSLGLLAHHFPSTLPLATSYRCVAKKWPRVVGSVMFLSWDWKLRDDDSLRILASSRMLYDVIDEL